EAAKEQKEAEHRLELYRKNRPPLDLKNTTVILVDDGLATGATMRAAVYSAKAKKAKKIIVAVPIAAQSSLAPLKEEADGIIYCEAPDSFGAVSSFYELFDQTTDEEVIQLLS
ncbi:MAG: phosphoribosyltransferase, partial [Deltaproteobacteria bacterium]|nr:phosphoribosyltransferase [Deltaproteobacteria bacterium]